MILGVTCKVNQRSGLTIRPRGSAPIRLLAHYHLNRLVPMVLIYLVRRIIHRPLFFMRNALLFLSKFLRSNFRYPSQMSQLRRDRKDPMLNIAPLGVRQDFCKQGFPMRFRQIAHMANVNVSTRQEGGVNLRLFAVLLRRCALLNVSSRLRSRRTTRRRSSVRLGVIVGLRGRFLLNRAFLLFVRPT